MAFPSGAEGGKEVGDLPGGEWNRIFGWLQRVNLMRAIKLGEPCLAPGVWQIPESLRFSPAAASIPAPKMAPTGTPERPTSSMVTAKVVWDHGFDDSARHGTGRELGAATGSGSEQAEEPSKAPPLAPPLMPADAMPIHIQKCTVRHSEGDEVADEVSGGVELLDRVVVVAGRVEVARGVSDHIERPVHVPAGDWKRGDGEAGATVASGCGFGRCWSWWSR